MVQSVCFPHFFVINKLQWISLDIKKNNRPSLCFFFSTSFKNAKHNSLTDKLKKKGWKEVSHYKSGIFFFICITFNWLKKSHLLRKINYDHWSKFKNKNKSDIIIIK